jgi:hypothetical protein
MSLPEPDPRSTTSTPPGTPRWVKVSAIIAIVLVLLVLITMFVVGGNHGPGRHLPSSGTGGFTAPSAYRVHQL